MPRTRSQNLYLVRYRREGHPLQQSRPYLQEYAARRLVDRLAAGNPDLAPLTQLSIDTIPLGAPRIENCLGASHDEQGPALTRPAFVQPDFPDFPDFPEHIDPPGMWEEIERLDAAKKADPLQEIWEQMVREGKIKPRPGNHPHNECIRRVLMAST